MTNPFTIKEVRDFWDGVASIYEASNARVGYVHSQRYEKALEFARLAPGMKVLNVWSRAGGLIPYLRKTDGLEIRNREVSPRMTEIAKKKFPQEDFALTDLEHFPEFGDEAFDRIVSLETLEHVPTPSAYLSELRRMLKPGGLLVMSLPPGGAELPEFIYTLFFHDHGEGPHRFLWSWEVKRLLKEAGLTLVAHRPYILLPLGNDRLTRLGEKILTGLLGWTPLGEFGVRHFYICTK